MLWKRITIQLKPIHPPPNEVLEGDFLAKRIKMSEESSEFDQQIEKKNKELRDEKEERFGEEE